MKVALLTTAALIGLFGLTGCTGQSQSPTTSAPADSAAPTTSAATPETAEAEPTDPAAAPSSAEPPAESTEPAAAPATAPAASAPKEIEGKEHFAGDHASAGPADAAKIKGLAKQWHSAEKEALFHEKMDGSGLSSSVPAEEAETFYGQAVAACQRRYDGYAPPLQGAALEIEKLALSVYCPELG